MISIQKLAGLIALVMLAAVVIAVVPAAVLKAGWRRRPLQELIPVWWIHEAALQMEIAVRSFRQY